MNFKKFSGRAAALFLAAALLGAVSSAQAADVRLLKPVGCTVGIEMTLGGLMVAALTTVQTETGECCPAAEAGLQQDDLITHLGETEIETVEDFLAAASAMNGEPLPITVEREGETRRLTVTPQRSKLGCWELGLLLREGISGIGTLTFYDPESGSFGALGHPISDTATGNVLPLGEGSVLRSTVCEILAGKAGQAGELIGSFSGEKLGEICANTPEGIFGEMAPALFEEVEALPVASEAEISLGLACIRANLCGEEVREYTIEITRLYRGGNGDRCMMICVTDPALLALSGGIVQGMSGSPVLQNGKLIGAVTHVLVSDPTRGYAISIERMLQAAAA